MVKDLSHLVRCQPRGTAPGPPGLARSALAGTGGAKPITSGEDGGQPVVRGSDAHSRSRFRPRAARDLSQGAAAGARRSDDRAADRRRAVEPDLSSRLRLGRRRSAQAAGGRAAALGARGRSRASGDGGARPDRRPGAEDAAPLHRSLGDRHAVLRHGGARRAGDPRFQRFPASRPPSGRRSTIR